MRCLPCRAVLGERRCKEPVTPNPVLVSILRLDTNLVASVHAALNDSEMVQFQRDLTAQIGIHRSRGVIIDVAALDVLDSFGSRTLRNIAEMARLRGAFAVLVGIQPDVAMAMAQLGLGSGSVATALDLQEGLALLGSRVGTSKQPNKWRFAGDVSPGLPPRPREAAL